MGQMKWYFLLELFHELIVFSHFDKPLNQAPKRVIFLNVISIIVMVDVIFYVIMGSSSL